MRKNLLLAATAAFLMLFSATSLAQPPQGPPQGRPQGAPQQ